MKQRRRGNPINLTGSWVRKLDGRVIRLSYAAIERLFWAGRVAFDPETGWHVELRS